MRVITVRQPWAWAIIHGQKDVENRTRNIAGAYLGPVAIHAGLSTDTSDLSAKVMYGAWLRWWKETRKAGVDVGQQRGAIIGVVDLTDVHPDCTELVEPYGHTPTCTPWAMSGHWHLCLANARPLARPIPWRGALGLRTVPADIEAAIREQVTV